MSTFKKKDFYKKCYYNQDFKKGIGLKYKKVFELVRSNQSILEIGCHTGYLGEVFKKRGNRIWGIEINSDAADKAKPFYEKVLIGDIEDANLWNTVVQKFDVILFLDVLEHLVDPWRILIKSREFLNPQGFIIITLPNIAFYAIRKNLLFGRFDYQESGIIDKTHLRFFTFHSAQKFIYDCGYTIEKWLVTFTELPLEYRLPFLEQFYKKIKPLLSKFFPNLFGAVIFFKAIPKK